MTRRGGFSGRMTLRTGSEWDAQTIHAVRLAAPIGITTVGLPAVALGLRGIRLLDQAWLLDVGMGGLTVLLTLIMYRISNARGWHRKWMHVCNVAISMGWLTASAMVSHLFWPLNGLMWTVWCLMAIGGSMAWILMNWRHADGLQDIIDAGAPSDPAGPRYIDVGFIARALANAPVMRSVTRAATPAFPVLGRLHAQRAIESGGVIEGEVIEDRTAAEAEDERLRLLAAQKNWITIQSAWQTFTTRRPAGRELHGARLMLVEMAPSRIKTKVLLKKGHHLPEMVLNVREHLAVMIGTNKKNIVHVPQSEGKDGEVFLDWIMNTAQAKKIIEWPGAPVDWSSVGSELVYGVYDDGKPASLFMAGDPEKGIVLRHLAIEGTTGAGKSNFARIAVTAGLKQFDVVDWAIDPKKAQQTWGPVSPALDLITVAMETSEKFCDFLMDVIEARFRFLGNYDYSQWEPGCGIPFLRVWVSEGNMVLPHFGDRLDEAARVARSAGVMLIVDAQSWHHGDIPTPFRALFADKMQYGVAKIGDAFLLEKALHEAGADPSWGVSVPGKHYWMRSDLPLESQIMPVRSFYAKPDVTLAACRELAEAKHARVLQEFPEWTELLKSVDANGVYEKRLTGMALRASIDANIAKRDAAEKGTPIPAPRTETPEPKVFVPPAVTETIETTEVVEDMTSDDQGGRERLNPSDDEMKKEMSRMGGNADWLDAVGPETPGALESMMPHPDEILSFETNAGKPHSKQRTLAHLIAYLAKEIGPGKEFTPEEVGGVCREFSGKSRSWYRQTISSDLLAMGVVKRDERKGAYRVSLDIFTERVRAQVDGELAKISD